MKQNNLQFEAFLQKSIYLFNVMNNPNDLGNFVALFNSSSELIKIIRNIKFTESFFKKLLNAVKNKDTFYNDVMNYYIEQKVKKEKAKELFLKLIDDKWIVENVIFVKGPVMSYQLYGNIDERLYTDIDIITKRENLSAIYKKIKGNIRLNEKFFCEITTDDGEMLEIVFSDYLPFPIRPMHIVIYNKHLITLDILDTARTFLYLSLYLGPLNTSIVRNSEFLHICSKIVNPSKNKIFSIGCYIGTQIEKNNLNDEILRDFFLIRFYEHNIFKKRFYLLRFLKKYNLAYDTSYLFHSYLYIIRKIQNYLTSLMEKFIPATNKRSNF